MSDTPLPPPPPSGEYSYLGSDAGRYAEPSHGADRPRRPVWARRGFLVVSTAAAVGLVGAGIAVAANSPTPTPSRSAGTQAPYGGPGQHMGGRGFMGGPGMRGGIGVGHMGGVLHGEFVVPKQGGGYQTLDVQTGTATAVSGTSLTVKSADGFTKTYTVPAGAVVSAQRDGVTTIAKGDQVSVVASGTTAQRVVDVTKLRAAGPRWGDRDDDGQSGGSTAPSTTTG